MAKRIKWVGAVKWLILWLLKRGKNQQKRAKNSGNKNCRFLPMFIFLFVQKTYQKKEKKHNSIQTSPPSPSAKLGDFSLFRKHERSFVKQWNILQVILIFIVVLMEHIKYVILFIVYFFKLISQWSANYQIRHRPKKNPWISKNESFLKN